MKNQFVLFISELHFISPYNVSLLIKEDYKFWAKQAVDFMSAQPNITKVSDFSFRSKSTKRLFTFQTSNEKSVVSIKVEQTFIEAFDGMRTFMQSVEALLKSDAYSGLVECTMNIHKHEEHIVDNIVFFMYGKHGMKRQYTTVPHYVIMYQGKTLDITVNYVKDVTDDKYEVKLLW